MSASPRRDLEILIHTAAPSSGHDDARYRALAHAYLHFEPARRQEIYRRPSDDELEDEQAGSQLQEELILSTQERPGSESYQPQEESHSTQYSTQYVVEEESPTEDGSDGNADQDIARRIMDSPQLSFGSVLDNVDSPVFRGLEYTTMVIASDGVQPNNPPADDGNADSWQPPPSTIEDSQPNRNHHKSTALFSSPTRVLELYLRHFKTAKDTDLSQSQKRDQWSLPITISTSTDSIEIRSERSTSSITSSPTGGAQNRTAGRLQMNRSQSLRERQTQDQTQVDNPVGDLRPTACPLPDGNEGRRSTFKRRHQEASSPTNSPSATERTTNPPKRARPGLESSENQSSSNNIPSSNPLISTPPLLSATDTTSYCLEIHPPPPTISDMDLTPSSLVTKSLQGLAERMKLKAKFQPLEQSRELRPMERGYWVVNWQIWSPALQKRSWSLLQNYVGKGGAGWGVWCTRDEDFRMFRVYCWGGIVGHVYLVLFAASETKIKGTGACWIDGQGQTVITMP